MMTVAQAAAEAVKMETLFPGRVNTVRRAAELTRVAIIERICTTARHISVPVWQRNHTTGQVAEKIVRFNRESGKVTEVSVVKIDGKRI